MKQIEIIELAEFIYSDFATSEGLLLETIADEQNIKYAYNYYGHSFDGMLEYGNGTFFIYCNLDRVEKRNSPRARFTFAHELGHYFIDSHRNILKSGKNLHHPSLTDRQSKNIIERQADCFASYLLMPREVFNKKLKEKKSVVGITEICRIANFFQTSLTSTATRYVEKSSKPSAVIIWDNEGNCSWHWKSKSIRQRLINRPIDNLNILGPESATYKAYNQKTQQVFKNGSTFSTFFSSVSSNGYDNRNIIIFEEAIKLGRFGVLTFLYPDKDMESFY